MIGNVHSANLTQDQAAKSFSGYIARKMPAGDAPLFALSSMLKTETALQFQHGYWMKSMVFPSVTTSGSHAAGVTLITVTSAANIIPGMVLRVDGTGENMLVLGVVGTSQIQVQRGFGTIAAATIPTATLCIQAGNAQEEASLRPQPFTIQMQYDDNFTHIFRNSWAVSGTAAATRVIAGSGNVSESKMDCAAMHASDIEKGTIFSQKYVGIRNGQAFHTMDGLVNIITSKVSGNVTTLGSTTTFTQFETAVDPLLNIRTDQMSGNERVMFGGGGTRKVMNQIAMKNGNYNLVDGMTSFGLQFSTFKTTRGVFRIIEHPLFNAYGSNTTYAKMALILDMAAIRYAYLGNRRTKAVDFMDEDGQDAEGGTLTTELTILCYNPAACGIIYNFTQGATG